MTCRMSPSWPTRSGRATCAVPRRVTAASVNVPGTLNAVQLLARPRRREVALDEADAAGRVGPVGRALAGQQPAHHLVGRPRHGRDGRDAEPLVDHRAARVVDARHDAVDLEGLACDACRHDVGVVAARDRRHRAGVADAGLLERVAVEAEADDAIAAEALRQPAERVLLLVDDGDGVPEPLERPGELAADPPASDHDHVHCCRPLCRLCPVGPADAIGGTFAGSVSTGDPADGRTRVREAGREVDRGVRPREAPGLLLGARAHAHRRAPGADPGAVRGRDHLAADRAPGRCARRSRSRSPTGAARRWRCSSGRARVRGLTPGRRMVVEGVPVQEGSEKLVYNPTYELLA